MTDNFTLKVIARIKSDFPDKFGIPRQSGLVETLLSRVVFEPTYRNAEALRGIEEYSHLWLIWGFSKVEERDDEWSPTVRPPRLGGNKRVGVFATRSPYRPNRLGLSSVTLVKIEKDAKYGNVLVVGGADLMDGTPIYDIKPYLPISDLHAEAKGGFSDEKKDYKLRVILPKELAIKLPSERAEQLVEILSEDPRPSYIDDSTREYGFYFSDYEIKFKVLDKVLTVTAITNKL